jgi:peroxiredoxin
MAERFSQMLELGTAAPEFSLPDPDGNEHDLGTDAAAYLVMFICNHCPYVKHVREELARLGNDYLTRNTSIVALNSNDSTMYPGDSPEKMKEEAATWGYAFPYLIDATQTVAKAYRAACTPDFFVFDANKLLVYRGQLDGSRPGNDIAVTGGDLRAAIDAVLGGTAAPADQVPSIGCSIKWTQGNEPDYF